MRALILRFEAPLMAFGCERIDQEGRIWRFPGTSMLAGLIGNALGWMHADTGHLQALQERLRFAARWDVAPQRLTDYQTADLDSASLREKVWTTRGIKEHRGNSPNMFGTHQRYQDYWSNGVMTLALAVRGEDEPTLSTIGEALRRPARPLFLGRKPCLPHAPIWRAEVEGANVLEALRRYPLHAEAKNANVEASWPADLGHMRLSDREVLRHDRRDWANQAHSGDSRRIEGLMEIPTEEVAHG